MRDTKFLIIDANPENRGELSSLLKELGQNFDQPLNPTEASELLQESRYDCVLVDRDIPQEWHNVMSSSPAPLVFLTGPKGSHPPSATEVNSADGYLPRSRDCVSHLMEHVQKAISRLASSRKETIEDRSKKSEEFELTSTSEEVLNDPRIIIRTGRISNHGPTEDISLVSRRGQDNYAALLGDFTGPEEIRDLEIFSLKRRISTSLRENPDPGGLLDEINTKLIQDNGAVDFMTAIALFVDLSNKKLTYSVAGHQPPLHRRWGSRMWRTLPGQGIPLGIRNGQPYDQHEKKLWPGDKILLISDGFLKMRGAVGGLMDIETAIGEINQLPPDAAPHEIFEEVNEIVQSITGRDGVADEITLMLIQV